VTPISKPRTHTAQKMKHTEALESSYGRYAAASRKPIRPCRCPIPAGGTTTDRAGQELSDSAASAVHCRRAGRGLIRTRSSRESFTRWAAWT
jgi:hypothetical protein